MNPPKMAAWNLGLRFLLEIAALIGVGALMWDQTSGVVRWIAVIAVPVAVAAVWGIFNVADDPSRSGGAPVAVPGWVRLFLELLVLAGGAVSVGVAWGPWLGWAMAGLILVHYAVSLSRVRWLVGQ